MNRIALSAYKFERKRHITAEFFSAVDLQSVLLWLKII